LTEKQQNGSVDHGSDIHQKKARQVDEPASLVTIGPSGIKHMIIQPGNNFCSFSQWLISYLHSFIN